MKRKARPATLRSRADEGRSIAQGVYDEKERRILLRFINDWEKFSKTKIGRPDR
jgi:hypothetical protein